MSKLQIKARWSSAVVFECELSASLETASERDQRGYAIKEALKAGLSLSGSDLSGSDLSDSNLSDSNLRDSDLSGSLNGVPTIPNIHQAVFSAASKPGALNMGAWHACETTHCRAGWVVHLAGAAGKAMEYCLGTPAAASLIYLASDPAIERVPNFYAGNEEALADMRMLAEKEAAAA